ncbi:DUF4124 domain-containing protein [Rhodoferax sp.]|uniref:DUF4124 domain-containing protein n=1 Tax=Rhodoferax sp. TaxID=50421 RepID=UPI0025E52785|nr:DUF4124 domain-containing protein [Rhodoferax sp.]
MTQILHLSLILASLLCFDATAQWAWTDNEGRQVFSDRAPPISVPEKNILRRPGQIGPINNPETSVNVNASEAAATLQPDPKPVANSPQASGVDKALTERMAKAEQALASQRKAEEERINQLRADNCERARLAQKNLDSGTRLSRINSQGVREVMDAAARAEEAKHVQSVIDSDCN